VKALVLEYWTPLLVWIFTIFYFSTDTFSSAETSRFIGPLLMFLFPGLSSHQYDDLHGVVRKLAHVGAYFALGFFAYRSCRQNAGLAGAAVRAGMFVFVTALLDEFHQSFTASRGASIIDVGYDCLGGFGALLLITIYGTRRIRSYSVL
jgi:VanZ family protein